MNVSEVKLNGLVLSIFPGLDLLGMGFESEEFTVVRGPDLIWGRDVRDFHPPSGMWAGVIGAPPCQIFSRMRYINPACGQTHGNMIPEFERIVSEAQPEWFVMENVTGAPEPVVDGYIVRSLVLNNRWLPDENGIGAEQYRVRRFSFGTGDGRVLFVQAAALNSPISAPTVVAGHGATPTTKGKQRTERSFEEMCRLQGLREGFWADGPYTVQGKRRLVGNAVPLPMARAIARAVRRAFPVPPEKE